MTKTYTTLHLQIYIKKYTYINWVVLNRFPSKKGVGVICHHNENSELFMYVYITHVYTHVYITHVHYLYMYTLHMYR